ncbi:MAG: VCBS repeat-containing protein [Ignavibacterium sp.]|nr:VCBS repeat-containing protein [Ignavibacterium sp.]
MKKIVLLFSAVLLITSALQAQTTPIEVQSYATFNAYAGTAPDSSTPYFNDLGVRRVIVADVDNDGEQEVISTDYSNGGRVHVLKHDGAGNLEIVWSSPVSATSSGSTPRFPQVGDCDGDGMPEIIFEQNGERRIAFYEWDGSSWGSEPAFEITDAMFSTATGTSETLRLNRETLLVKDLDGDGRSEIICHTSDKEMFLFYQ